MWDRGPAGHKVCAVGGVAAAAAVAIDRPTRSQMKSQTMITDPSEMVNIFNNIIKNDNNK